MTTARQSEYAPSEVITELLKEAGKSLCAKRKVGAIIYHSESREIVARGHNHNTDPITDICEDCNGNTLSTVVHAEIAAINELEKLFPRAALNIVMPTFVMAITCEPCAECKEAMKAKNIHYIVCTFPFTSEFTESAEPAKFTKYDSGKWDPTIVSPDMIHAIAKVMEFGAQKYGRDNWRKCENPEKLLAATLRHIHAHQKGEVLDTDSDLPHLHHALCNLAFIAHFKELELEAADE